MSFDGISKKAASLSTPYIARMEEDDELWEDSPFDWIRRLASSTRGKIGRDLARGVFEEYGYTPRERKDSFDIKGVNIISRSSMLWDGDHWKFQQVRNTPFKFLFCLAYYPDSASTWLIPKEELYLPTGELRKRDGWGPQHGGKSGKEDAWLKVPTSNPPAWLGKYGGDIANIPKVFKRLLPKP